MQTEQLFNQVATAVGGVLNTKPGEIKPESRFREDLGAESIDMIDISFEIEKATGKELDFKQVIDYLNKAKGASVKDISVSDLVTYLQHLDA
jgi:acyl carrier protein